MLASEIQLFPDKTIFIQLGIFLVVLMGLNFLVFKPVLNLIRLRRERTLGEQEQLKELQEKSEALMKEYEAKMTAAKQEGFKMREAIRREGEAQAQKIVREAKGASQTQMENFRKEIEREVETAERQLKKEALAFGQGLAEKVLGRPLAGKDKN